MSAISGMRTDTHTHTPWWASGSDDLASDWDEKRKQTDDSVVSNTLPVEAFFNKTNNKRVFFLNHESVVHDQQQSPFKSYSWRACKVRHEGALHNSGGSVWERRQQREPEKCHLTATPVDCSGYLVWCTFWIDACRILDANTACEAAAVLTSSNGINRILSVNSGWR